MSQFQDRVRPKLENETPRAFVDRLRSIGVLPIPLIKQLRGQYLLDLKTAREVAFSDEEYNVFLEALFKRGVNRDGAEKLLGEVYGETKICARQLVENSTFWCEVKSK